MILDGVAEIQSFPDHGRRAGLADCAKGADAGRFRLAHLRRAEPVSGFTQIATETS
jgi:hypothetical protein